jgi:hypothetical protein
VTAVPDALVAGATAPQAAPLHPLPVTAQITPLFPESLATVAVKGWVPFTVTFAVLPDNVTAIGAAPAVTMIVATADFVASATDVAVSWTIAMAGTIPGAL